LSDVLESERSTCVSQLESTRASTNVVRKSNRLYDSHYILTKQEQELEQRIERQKQ
jgi:hypothetical protein